jgi:putative FmdB family regulatory protein
MPLYEYYCPPCGSRFELLRPMSQMDDAATCPSGHTTNNRVLSIFAPVMKTGGGVATETATATQMGIDACSAEGPGHFGCSCC